MRNHTNLTFYQCHFSKESYLAPLPSKHAHHIADAMIPYIMIQGSINIWQCDNGSEFKGAMMMLARRHGIKVVNGNPRHPQSQGLVEQGNSTLKAKIRAWMHENQSSHWVFGLVEVSLHPDPIADYLLLFR